MNRRYFLASAAGLALPAFAAETRRVLVYTRNYTPDGKGYVHDNIATSVDTIRALASSNGYTLDASDDPQVFTPDNLKKYAALVFSNSNNEAFTSDAQRAAFRGFIQTGGGYVGIHSSSASEREWPYYWAVAGGKFVRHPKQQPLAIRVVDRQHPATRDLPAEFVWTDECYYHDHIHPTARPLLVTDPARIEDPQKNIYPGDRFGNALPLAWWNDFEGARQIYVALGHNKKDYESPILRNLIAGSIRWAIGESK